VHLGGDDSAGQDTATDRDHTGEGALLVDVGALNGGLGRAVAQTNILMPSLGSSVLLGTSGLVIQEDVRLHVRISIAKLRNATRRVRVVVPASGKRARTGHCFSISMSTRLQYCCDIRELGGHGCGRDVLSVCWSVVVVEAAEFRVLA